MKRILVLLFVAFLMGVTISANAKSGDEMQKKCYGIGDVVTVKGIAIGNTNGGTYFKLLSQLCVHYPRKTDKINVSELTTLGDKLEPDVYLEITGALGDPYPLYGVGIHVSNAINIDELIKAKLANERQACSDWRASKLAELKIKMHGGNVGPSDVRDNNGNDMCCLIGGDKELPHGVVTICKYKKQN